MIPGAVAVIRPAALHHNLARVRELAPGCPVLAVIKANAYGHGLIEVARILDGADAFAVARMDEAQQLRAAGIDKRVVLLGGCLTTAELDEAGRLGIDIVVHSMDQVALLESAAVLLDCWLKVDSGMSRLGIAPETVPTALARLRKARAVRSTVLMTHLACADDPADPATDEQLRRFGAVLDGWDGEISVANSAAILHWPDALRSGGPLRYRGRNWVRPGLMLYGASPMRRQSARQLGLQPAMSFETRLIAVKPVRRGQRVGYGGHWVAPRDGVLGVVAVGYADGYPWQVGAQVGVQVGAHAGRDAGSVAVVGIRQQAAPVVGRVSMDMLTVDLTEVPDARPGDRVVLWGDSPTVEEVAVAARTIPWTLLTAIGRRVALRPGRNPS